MIKPLHDYVLLEKEVSEKKVGAILLTKEEKKGNVARVLALGEGEKKEGKLFPIEGIKVGDEVIYREYSGTEYEEGEKKYLLIKSEDIIAVISK